MKHERFFDPPEPPGPPWEACVQFMHRPPRLMMRRKVDGCWQYREPTGAEYEDHMSAEAW
jgi:hypothetical protein